MKNGFRFRRLVICLLFLTSNFSHAGIWDDIVNIFSSDDEVEKTHDIAILEYGELNDLRTTVEENQDVLTEIFLEKRKALDKAKDDFIRLHKLSEWKTEVEKRNKKETLDSYLNVYYKNMRSIYDEYQRNLSALTQEVLKEIDNRNNNVADIVNLFSENYTLPKYENKYIEAGDFDSATKYCIDRGFESGEILTEKPLYFNCVSVNKIISDDSSYIKVIKKEGVNLTCSHVLFSSNSKVNEENKKESQKAHEVLSGFKSFSNKVSLSSLFNIHSWYSPAWSLNALNLEVAFDIRDISGVQLYARKINEDEYGNKIDDKSRVGAKTRGTLIYYNPENGRHLDYHDLQDFKESYGERFYKDSFFQDFYNIGINSFHIKTKNEIVTSIKCSKEPTVGQKIESHEKNIYSQFQGVESKYSSQLKKLDASRKHARSGEK